jgi:hypothetical protein
MAGKTRGIIIGGFVVAALMQAEHEAPGATGRGAAELRGAVTPAASEAVGAAGDAILVVRDEASRQGINPAAILAQPDAAATRDADGIAGVDDQGGGTLGG